MSLFDDLTKQAEKESSGAGIVALVLIETGYKLFQPGTSNRDSWFPCDYSDDKSREAALNAGKAKAHGSERVSLAIQLQVFKSTVKGRDVTWQDDRFFCYPLWTNAAKKVVIPSLKTAGVETLGKYWARISFADDPDGRTKKNQNGEDVIDKIAFVSEIFKSENDAAAAALSGTEDAASSTPAPVRNGQVPEAFKEQPDAWWAFIKELKLVPEIKGKPAPIVAAYVKQNYSNPDEVGATVEEIIAALK